MNPLDEALNILGALVLESGARWGEVATPEQWVDAQAILDLTSPTPYNFLTRARGYSKTGDLGGIGVAVLLAQVPAASSCYGIAADRDQARLLIDSIRGYVARTPEIAGALTVDAFRATTRDGTFLEALAADVAGSWGLRPAFLVVDELAQWASTPAPRLLWEATTTALVKVPGARLVVLTSAGDPTHWSHRVLQHAKADPLWRVHEIGGPPPWADPARLAEQRRRLLESSYRRLFENQWTAAEARLVSPSDLAACVQHIGPLPPKPGRSHVLGLDLGIRHDRSVAAIVHAVPLGVAVDPDVGVKVVLDRMEVWAGSPSQPVDLTGVEEWVVEAMRRYAPCDLVGDPWQAVGLFQRLERRGFRVTEFTFSQASMGRLAVNLHALMKNHALALPDDEALLDELGRVRLRETSPNVFRLDHDADQHDDRAVALGLAALHLVNGHHPSGALAWLAAIAPPCPSCGHPNAWPGRRYGAPKPTRCEKCGTALVAEAVAS